ncbi:MAG: pyridoxal phosphate-dependent aminotransferase [Actinocatenispora sp.]
MLTARSLLTAYTMDSVPLHPDAQLIRDRLAARPDHDPIPLSIGCPGFTGGQPPAGLRAYLAEAPRYTNGYQYSSLGLPEARRSIADHLVADQRLAEHADPGRDLDVALTSHGTRSAMRDFGRWLLAQHPSDPRTPVALCATPSWDYAGPLEPLGYQLRYWPLRAENGWRPHADDLRDALAAIDADERSRLAVVIVNAQHNPTGRSWPAHLLRELYEAAHRRGAGVLLDDPYYAIHTNHPDAAPSSAPRELLATLYAEPGAASDTARRHWCAVRSLGKQFGVNGWGVGTVTAHPDTLADLADLAFQWTFPVGADRQWAMARWLADPGAARWLADQRGQLSIKRNALATSLRALGWPAEAVTVGECTPYALVRVPPGYQALPDGAQRWRHDLWDATGVLLSPATVEHPELDVPYLRMYLGTSPAVLHEALGRLRRAGVSYHAEPRPVLPRPRTGAAVADRAGTGSPVGTVAGAAALARVPVAGVAAADDAARRRARARTRQDAAQLLRELAATAYDPTDQAIVESVADWFRPNWYVEDDRPAGAGAAATALLDAAHTARWDHHDEVPDDAMLTVPPLRVPDRASVLLDAIARHTHPDSAAALAAVGAALADDTHRVVDVAIGEYLHASTMRDLAIPQQPACQPGAGTLAGPSRPPSALVTGRPEEG